MTVPLLTAGVLQMVPLAVSDTRLIVVALAGFAVIIALITWLKVHPFLALAIGSIGVGPAAGVSPFDPFGPPAIGRSNSVGSSDALVAPTDDTLVTWPFDVPVAGPSARAWRIRAMTSVGCSTGR